MNRHRAIILVLAVPVLLTLLSAAFLAWLTTTSSGLRFAATIAESAASPALRIEAPTGSLLGAIRIARIVYETPERRVAAEELELHWRPRLLLDRLLLIESLDIDRLQVSSRRDEQKREPPQRLTLPFAARLERFHIGAVNLLENASASPQVTGISGRFSSDGVQHQVDDLQFTTSRLALHATAKIGGVAPFPVTAKAHVEGEELRHPLGVSVDASGTLEELKVTAQSTVNNLKVNGAATLNVFAAQPLREGSLAAADLNPAAWLKAAPHARLSVNARIAPASNDPAMLVGEVIASNSEPGPLDQQRIPLRHFQARIRQKGERIELTGFTAAVANGEVKGSAVWEKRQLAVIARVSNMDTAAWHKMLSKTKLSGELAVKVSADSLSVKARLQDPRFHLVVDATRSGSAIRLQTARVDAKGGSLEVSGQVDPHGKFAFDGRLQRFDPSVFVNISAASLNAVLGARGQFGESPTMDLNFALRDSRFAGRPVAGHGEVILHRERLERVDVSLQAGDNRIAALGNLGAPNDKLNISIAANRLEDVGLGGSMRGEITLSGELRRPAAAWNLNSPSLAMPGKFRIREMASQGRLEPKGDTILANVTIAAVDLEKKGPPLAGVSASIEGQRHRHRLRATAKVGKDNSVLLGASGDLGDNRVWSGLIETLEWHGPNPVHLIGGTHLDVGPGLLQVKRAKFAGNGWDANVDGMRWQAGRLQSAGRFSKLPVAPFLPAAAPTTTLRMGGEWNIDFGSSATGRIRVFRQEGDLVLKGPDQTTTLGLDQLALTAEFTGHSAELSLTAAAAEAGTVAGRLTAGLRMEEGRWTLARYAPWHGNVELDSRSLAWLSPLVGNNVVFGGRLQGAARIAGTPAAPAIDGEMSGSDLRIQVPDYGLDLGGGTLRVEFTPDTVKLQRLEMISVATRPPSERRIDFRHLADQPGRLLAEGDIALQSGIGQIRLRAEHLTISERSDRWVMVSGTGDVRFAKGQFQVNGDFRTNAAYVEVSTGSRPKLSPDVVVVGRQEKNEARALRLGVDVSVDFGDSFYFHGAGIDTRLAGQLHLVATRLDQLRAEGSLRTVGGTFDAYGHELAIERGILNFQGLVTNPGLNVRALRKNLPVEAGVEVNGTVKNPKVRLVSEPDVPDTEKLSWMVLGRPPSESVGGNDADLLLSAAMALRGGSRDKGALQSLTQGLGLEQLALSSGKLGETSNRFPSSHVAGSFTDGGTPTAAEQIASVGKRIGSNAVLSYERSINTAESVLKLTVELTQRLSLIGRVGENNAIGFLYSFTFWGGSKENPGR